MNDPLVSFVCLFFYTSVSVIVPYDPARLEIGYTLSPRSYLNFFLFLRFEGSFLRISFLIPCILMDVFADDPSTLSTPTSSTDDFRVCVVDEVFLNFQPVFYKY